MSSDTQEGKAAAPPRPRRAPEPALGRHRERRDQTKNLHGTGKEKGEMGASSGFLRSSQGTGGGRDTGTNWILVAQHGFVVLLLSSQEQSPEGSAPPGRARTALLELQTKMS